ncbi:hypothetical protein ACC691_39590, partial [Rhizobium johnstonii]|uniref:hypothetical protein n=1 Tax=Rhizobium johnstonii TaxID=3019933 RepID=UPI003F9B1D7C
LGAAVYLAMVSVIAFSIGTLVRSTAAGITITLALYLAVPTVLALIAAATKSIWLSNLALFLPTGSTGAAFYATYLGPNEIMEQVDA